MQAAERLGLECVAKWDFGADEDTNNDHWPDGWTRRRGASFPGFIPIEIARRSLSSTEVAEIERFRRFLAQCYLGLRTKRWPWQVIPEAVPVSIDRFLEQSIVNPYLSIEMDGSSAEVNSPMVAIENHSIYGMEVSIQTDHNDFEAGGQLMFYDRQRNFLFSTPTPRTTKSQPWTAATSPMFYTDDPRIAFVQVALTVSPKSSKAFRGSFGFDRVRVWRMPKIRLMLDRANRLYRIGEPVQMTCEASGLKEEQMRIELSLVDHTGAVIHKITKDLERAYPEVSQLIATDTPNILLKAKKSVTSSNHWQGKCVWTIKDLQPGYYEVSTKMAHHSSVMFELSQQFVVLPKMDTSGLDPRFGWTMNESAHGWNTDQFIDLIREGRTGRIKLPIWFNSLEQKSMDDYCTLVDRIQTAGISCVGVISNPPDSLAPKSSSNRFYQQASALEDPSTWQPLLEPVFRQMCVRLVDFQMGFDHETEYGSNLRFSRSIESLRSLLKRYGPESVLTAPASPWATQIPNAYLDRWQLTSDIEIADSENDAVEFDRRSPMPLPAWTSITPIPATLYSLSVRTQDLAGRMISTTKRSTSTPTTAWVSDPISDDVGFLGPDCGPREMFLPYRTLVDALYKKQYLGSIELLSGCESALLASDTHSCLILWSPRPVVEQLFLGYDVRATDVWGRKVPVTTVETQFGPEQRIAVDQWPVIVNGVDAQAARWRMGITLDQQRLDSLIGQSQEVKVNFINPFPFPVSGRLDLVAPEIFADVVESASFEVEPNSNEVIPVNVMLRPDTSSQDANVKLVVTIQGERTHRFAMNKTLRIGNDDVAVDVQYHIDRNDQLWIELEATNNTREPVSFDCMLLIPGRSRERAQLPRVVERASRTILLERARELIGETLWLRCEQVGSNRVLNYRVKIEANKDDEEESM